MFRSNTKPPPPVPPRPSKHVIEDALLSKKQHVNHAAVAVTAANVSSSALHLQQSKFDLIDKKDDHRNYANLLPVRTAPKVPITTSSYTTSSSTSASRTVIFTSENLLCNNKKNGGENVAQTKPRGTVQDYLQRIHQRTDLEEDYSLQKRIQLGMMNNNNVNGKNADVKQQQNVQTIVKIERKNSDNKRSVPVARMSSFKGKRKTDEQQAKEVSKKTTSTTINGGEECANKRLINVTSSNFVEQISETFDNVTHVVCKSQINQNQSHQSHQNEKQTTQNSLEKRHSTNLNVDKNGDGYLLKKVHHDDDDDDEDGFVREEKGRVKKIVRDVLQKQTMTTTNDNVKSVNVNGAAKQTSVVLNVKRHFDVNNDKSNTNLTKKDEQTLNFKTTSQVNTNVNANRRQRIEAGVILDDGSKVETSEERLNQPLTLTVPNQQTTDDYSLKTSNQQLTMINTTNGDDRQLTTVLNTNDCLTATLNVKKIDDEDGLTLTLNNLTQNLTKVEVGHLTVDVKNEKVDVNVKDASYSSSCDSSSKPDVDCDGEGGGEGVEEWTEMMNDRNHVNTLIDEMFASVLHQYPEESEYDASLDFNQSIDKEQRPPVAINEVINSELITKLQAPMLTIQNPDEEKQLNQQQQQQKTIVNIPASPVTNVNEDKASLSPSVNSDNNADDKIININTKQEGDERTYSPTVLIINSSPSEEEEEEGEEEEEEIERSEEKMMPKVNEKSVKFDDTLNHEFLIQELQSMKREQQEQQLMMMKKQQRRDKTSDDNDSEKVRKRQRAPSSATSSVVTNLNSGSVQNHKNEKEKEKKKSSRVSLLIENWGEKKSVCDVNDEDDDVDVDVELMKDGDLISRLNTMSNLQGLPPLPKSLSGFNLMESIPQHRAASSSSRTSTPSTGNRNSSHSTTPNDTLSKKSTSSLSSKPSSLDTQLAILRREMYSLRQLDLSLLSQLWSLNESIQDFRQILQEQEDRGLSLPSPSPSPSSGDEGENEEFYTPSPIKIRPAPPPPPLRRTSNSSSGTSSV